MNRLDALKKLLENVKEGTAIQKDCISALSFDGLLNSTADYACDAYHGSLTAAKMLHEDVLHERVVKLETWSRRYGGTVVLMDLGHQISEGANTDNNPARAWLIAILKVLIAKEQEA